MKRLLELLFNYEYEIYSICNTLFICSLNTLGAVVALGGVVLVGRFIVYVIVGH